jgi:hypothetical protein
VWLLESWHGLLTPRRLGSSSRGRLQTVGEGFRRHYRTAAHRPTESHLSFLRHNPGDGDTLEHGGVHGGGALATCDGIRQGLHHLPLPLWTTSASRPPFISQPELRRCGRLLGELTVAAYILQGCLFPALVHSLWSLFCILLRLGWGGSRGAFAVRKLVL